MKYLFINSVAGFGFRICVGAEYEAEKMVSLCLVLGLVGDNRTGLARCFQSDSGDFTGCDLPFVDALSMGFVSDFAGCFCWQICIGKGCSRAVGRFAGRAFADWQLFCDRSDSLFQFAEAL